MLLVFALVGFWLGGLIGILACYPMPKVYASSALLLAATDDLEPALTRTRAESVVDDLDLVHHWGLAPYQAGDLDGLPRWEPFSEDEDQFVRAGASENAENISREFSEGREAAIARVISSYRAIPGENDRTFRIEIRTSNPLDARMIAERVALESLHAAPRRLTNAARHLDESREITRKRIAKLQRQLANPLATLPPDASLDRLAALPDPESIHLKILSWQEELERLDMKAKAMAKTIAHYEANEPAPAHEILTKPVETYAPVSPDPDRFNLIGKCSGAFLGLFAWPLFSRRMSPKKTTGEVVDRPDLQSSPVDY